ncbi:MAG: MFS transporter [Faecousia sp.]
MKRRIPLCYAIVQGTIWGVYGFLFSFANRYLLARDLSSLRIGLILGIATGISFLLQPLLTALSDRLRFFSCRRILFLCAGLMTLCAAALLLRLSTPVIVILYAFATVCLQILPAFANALGMNAIRNGKTLNFGVSRGIGSVLFGVAAQVAIPLIDRFGLNTVPFCSAVLGILLMAAVLAFPELEMRAEEPTEQPTPALAFFRANGRFALLLVGVVLLYIGHNALSNCMYQIAVYKGDGNAQGTALLIAAFVELPTMFLFTKLLKLAKCERWLCLSCVFFTLRLALTLLLPGVYGLYAAQLAQMLGFALFAVSSVYYVGMVIDKRDVVKGQTYLAVANTLGCLIAHFLGGALIDGVGVGMALVIFTVLSILGGAISIGAVVSKSAKKQPA